MLKTRHFTICVALIIAVVATAGRSARAADEKQAAEDPQRPLIDVLQSDAPKAEKAITCKRLAVYGSGEAVPALAPLLADEELASWARIALEAIPDPAAGAALREALGKLQGRLLIGVINSIGVRRDPKAVDGLTQRLKGADAEVASAAAAALGRIGDAAATKTLEQALTGAAATIRSAVAEGCILCAERRLAEGKTKEAADLYDKVRQADVPKQRMLEATRGAILARGSAGVPLLIEQLRAADTALFAVALTTARELAGPEVAKALVDELGQATPDRQALLILALADRGDTEALPAMLKVAQSGPGQVRIAAIGMLKRLGDASCVPILLEIAVAAEEDVAQAAVAALEGLPGEGVNADLAARLGKAEGKLRQLLIQLVGLRRIEAVGALLKAADDSDAQIRSAALTALGETAGLDDLAVLITRVVAPQHAEDAPAAQQALRAACIRMPDGEACAGRLAAAMPQAPLPAKVTILEILSAMGGTRALQTVGAAAKDADPELQDAASRLLGEWMTVDAGPVLLDLAKTATDAKYETRALRGYIRLVRQFVLPDEQRVEMCRNALAAAKRDAEKKLVLEVLGRYPSIDALRLAVETAKIPSLKNEAAAAALAIAQKIGGSTDVQKLLSQVGQEPVKVEIVKAEYGAGNKSVDVTAILRKHARDLPLIVLPSSSYNTAFGGDPAGGVVKQLKVQYRMDGKAGEAVFQENDTILLPVPK
jgi:HEAT repeat protein